MGSIFIFKIDSQLCQTQWVISHKDGTMLRRVDPMTSHKYLIYPFGKKN